MYHELFDTALQRYNSKQKRADRKIKNYLQHIRHSKQEKEFHELIIQIGNKHDAERLDPNHLADLLEEYLKGFKERNPQLKVFSERSSAFQNLQELWKYTPGDCSFRSR